MGQKPTTFFGSSQKFEIELTDLVNEVAQDVAKYQDWQALVKKASIAGDGTTTAFDLPDDYDRQLVRSDMQNGQSWFWGYQRYNDINDFYYLAATGFNPLPGGWILVDNQIQFAPAPGASSTAIYPYVSKNYARDPNTATLKSAFTLDTDEFLLPDRLLTLGLVWRWRENKKLDSTGDQEAFAKALDEYAAKDQGSRIYRSNGSRFRSGVGYAWPWTLG